MRNPPKPFVEPTGAFLEYAWVCGMRIPDLPAKPSEYHDRFVFVLLFFVPAQAEQAPKR
jgi:hypothetical protein